MGSLKAHVGFPIGHRQRL